MAHSIAAAAKRNRDELYTPRVLSDVIIPHLKQKVEEIRYHKYREPIVWLPFDTEESSFAAICRENNFKYTVSHIWNGQDFFKYQPDSFDIVVSNPPFSKKLDVFKRLDSFKIPWAMVGNSMCLNYHEIIDYFADNPKELLFVNKRVSYDGNPSSFGSCFICNDFLYNDIEYVKIPHNNTGRFFQPSKMYKPALF